MLREGKKDFIGGKNCWESLDQGNSSEKTGGDGFRKGKEKYYREKGSVRVSQGRIFRRRGCFSVTQRSGQPLPVGGSLVRGIAINLNQRKTLPESEGGATVLIEEECN